MNTIQATSELEQETEQERTIETGSVVTRSAVREDTSQISIQAAILLTNSFRDKNQNIFQTPAMRSGEPADKILKSGGNFRT